MIIVRISNCVIEQPRSGYIQAREQEIRRDRALVGIWGARGGGLLGEEAEREGLGGLGEVRVPMAQELGQLVARRRVIPRPRQRGRDPHLRVPLHHPRILQPRRPPPHRHRWELGVEK